jgi:hypothetical protein
MGKAIGKHKRKKDKNMDDEREVSQLELEWSSVRRNIQNNRSTRGCELVVDILVWDASEVAGIHGVCTKMGFRSRRHAHERVECARITERKPGGWE